MSNRYVVLKDREVIDAFVAADDETAMELFGGIRDYSGRLSIGDLFVPVAPKPTLEERVAALEGKLATMVSQSDLTNAIEQGASEA